MDAARWLKERRFHHSGFDARELFLKKKARGLKLGLAIPTLNEESTVGAIVSTLRAALVEETPLLDELLVVDSGSGDNTVAEAERAGARVVAAADILPDAGLARGKGENLWKAGHVLADCDLLAFVDGDIRGLHPGFATGLFGPLLVDPDISFVKAYYDRPLQLDSGLDDPGGGRVTEILVRPLLSMLCPDLCAVIQPLSGEYAIRRDLFASLAIPSGYGVEIAMLIDIWRKTGFRGMAQVDLEQRVHRTRPTRELGAMSHAILQTAWQRLLPAQAARGPAHLGFKWDGADYTPTVEPYHDVERPPLESLAAYRARRDHPASGNSPS